MAYIAAWNEGLPLGSTDPALIDDLMRDLKRDIRERMDTILGAGKWASDPVVDYSNLHKYVHWSEGHVVKNLDDTFYTWDVDADYCVSNATSGVPLEVSVPIVLPVGATIKTIHGIFYRLNISVGAPTVKITRITSAGVSTIAGANFLVTTGWIDVPLAAPVNWIVAAGDFISGIFSIDNGGFGVGGGKFAGMIIDYSLPSMAAR